MAIVEYEAPNQSITEREQRARTLEAAALEIEVHGWATCDRRSTGEMCANGALWTALGWDGSLFSLRPPLQLAAQATWGRSYDYIQIAGFNDQLSRSAGPVLAPFLLRWRAEEIRDGWDH